MLATLFKKIPKEISWYTTAQLITQLCAFIGVSLISRYLGPTNLGLYSFAQNFIGIFLSCVNGLELYFTWQVAKSDRSIQETKKFFGHKLHITLLITILAAILSYSYLPSDVALLCTMMSLPLFLHSLTAFVVYSNAKNNAKVYAQSQIWAAIILLVGRIALVLVKAQLVYIVLLSSIELILTASFVTYHYLSQKQWSQEFFKYKLPRFLETLKLMVKIRFSISAFVLWQLILRIDQLILATFAGAYTLGIYSAATKIAEVPNFIAGILYIYTIPKFSTDVEKYAGSNVSFFIKYRKIVLSYLIISITISFCLILFAPQAIHIVYGAEYQDSIYILRLYALSIPPMFLTYFFFSLYGSENRYKLQSFIFGISLIINIVVIKAFNYWYGLPGVAISSFISYSVLVSIFALVYNRRHKTIELPH